MDVEARLKVCAATEGRDPADVAEEILNEGLEWVFNPAAESDWREMVKRRIEELDSGKVTGLPAEEVHARLRIKYP